jgi:hypothetical protein
MKRARHDWRFVDLEAKEAKNSIRETDPGLSGGALRNAAFAQMWRDADQDLWEQKRLDFISNVDVYVPFLCMTADLDLV